MSKKAYILTLIIALVAILAAFVLNYTPITKEVSKIFGNMQILWLAGSACLISLALVKKSGYWLISLGLSIVAALLIQWLVIGAPIVLIDIIYKAIAYLVYAYLVYVLRYVI